MATSTTIDVDDFHDVDTKDGSTDELSFQEFSHDSPSKGKGETHQFTNFPHSAADSDEEEDDQAELLKEKKGNSSFWTFAYYQQFFDVETQQVGHRILGSMVPRPGRNYLVKQIRPNPDLYGPFWICTTLVFTTAIAGNLANYFSLAGKDYNWTYDFHKVTLAASAIFSYWWIVPLIITGLLWWRGNQAKYTFLELICLYGYSLAIYIPISVLWAIQVSWLQWTLVVLGAVLSGSVLLLTFWPAVREDSKQIAIGIMVFIFVMHFALAAGFVLYFFHVPTAATSVSTITNSTTVAPMPHPTNHTIRKLDPVVPPPNPGKLAGGDSQRSPEGQNKTKESHQGQHHESGNRVNTNQDSQTSQMSNTDSQNKVKENSRAETIDSDNRANNNLHMQMLQRTDADKVKPQQSQPKEVGNNQLAQPANRAESPSSSESKRNNLVGMNMSNKDNLHKPHFQQKRPGSNWNPR